MITDSLGTIVGYEAAADDLIEKFERLSSAQIYDHLRDFLTPYPGDTLVDIGAGTGRDAAWFSELGYDVTAVEPVSAFLEYGARHYSGHDIKWLEDQLPALAYLRAQGRQYNMMVLSAVWQHLTLPERTAAMRNLAKLSAPGGRIIMSLRHGPGADDRPVVPISDEDTRMLAKRNGFETIVETRRPSVQTANQDLGVEWTWLVLQKPR